MLPRLLVQLAPLLPAIGLGAPPTHAAEPRETAVTAAPSVLRVGPHYTLISYGADGLKNPVSELFVVNNTIVSDRPAGARFVAVKEGARAARIVNNIFHGRGELSSGPVELSNNVTATRSDFVDPTAFDYRLKMSAAAIARGIDPGSAHGIELRPTAEYVHPAQRRDRTRLPLDVGAHEYTGR